MNRNRLPATVNRFIDHVADSPTSLLGRLAARRLGRPAPMGSVPVTTFDARPCRVLITPTNYSGQATAWARALETADPTISARSAAIEVPGGFAFDADLVVPVSTYHNDLDWQRRQFAAASHATHVLIEASEPPFGRLMARSVETQALALQDAGVSVAFLGHGTDVRLPSRHIRTHPWSHFNDETVYTPRLETLAARNIALMERSGRPLFVSTPDLLSDLPSAVWCPVVVDLDRWHLDRQPRDSGTLLRVAHAPSVGPLKGTPLILPILEKLEQEGVISFELVTGVASAEMPAVFGRADVVIDQVRAGSYGVAACEAMAAGCVVVGHVSESARSHVTKITGHRVPIVEADPDTLEPVLRALAASDLAELRARSREYVGAVHDGRLAANALLRHWIAPAPPEPNKGV